MEQDEYNEMDYNYNQRYEFFMDLLGNKGMSQTLANFSRLSDDKKTLIVKSPHMRKLFGQILKVAYSEKGFELNYDGFKMGSFKVCWKKLVRYGIPLELAKFICGQLSIK